MMNERTPDAVRSPLFHAGAGDSNQKLTKLRAEFLPVLKVPHLFVRHQGMEHFISGDSADTLNFHSQHARSSSPRYDWLDRGDGVLYGYLKGNA